MNLLTAEQITKVYTERVLLDKADFGINEGEKIGVIGINGTGKSTLLKIISGIEEPDEGKVTKGNQVHIRYLSQMPVFEKDVTILQAVLKDNVKEINEWNIESEAKSIINQLGLPGYETSVDHLSGGQKKRVALANALLAPVEILVLDEPTNHLDHKMADWLEEYLIKFKGAVVMVTHDRYFLDRVSTRIVEIDKGRIYSYPGSYSEFVRQKAERQNMELAAERKRQSILRVELQWLARGARARSTKQKAHIDRITAMQEAAGPVEDAMVQMSSVSSRMGRKTIELQNICKAYGQKVLIKDYSYIFLRNDRIGIVGENGCGKSTLLKIICQEMKADSGTVESGQTIRIGYFSQESESMDDSMRVIKYVKEVGEYIQTLDGTVTAAQMLERFLFDKAMQWSLIGKLSGGEKRRLYLLRVLMSEPNVLILDEPTNDLDIQTLTILEDYLDHFDGIVITVSHDRYFLDRVARRIFAFEENGVIRQYEGGYSDYLIKYETEHSASEEKKEYAPKEKKEDTRKTERRRKFTYNEQREFETIDDEIAALESAVEELNSKIAANATNSMKLNELLQAKEDTEKQLEEKMERWVYLNDLFEEIQKGGEK